MVVWQGLRLILAGIVTGAACVLAFSRLLSRLVFDSLTDPLVFAGVLLILLAIAILASRPVGPLGSTPWLPCAPSDGTPYFEESPVDPCVLCAPTLKAERRDL